LISTLENSRCRTGEIFAGAYLPQSVKEELDIRYGFISRYLDV
jgi:hypothetical protein